MTRSNSGDETLRRLEREARDGDVDAVWLLLREAARRSDFALLMKITKIAIKLHRGLPVGPETAELRDSLSSAVACSDVALLNGFDHPLFQGMLKTGGKRSNPGDEDLRRLIRAIATGDEDALDRFTAEARRADLPEDVLREAWRATVTYYHLLGDKLLKDRPWVESERAKEAWSEARYPLQVILMEKGQHWSYPWHDPPRRLNADEDLRDLERRAESGDREARLRLRRERRRRGLPDPLWRGARRLGRRVRELSEWSVWELTLERGPSFLFEVRRDPRSNTEPTIDDVWEAMRNSRRAGLRDYVPERYLADLDPERGAVWVQVGGRFEVYYDDGGIAPMGDYLATIDERAPGRLR